MESAVQVHAIVDEGLGNSCYLLDLGDGSALVVDPPRDLRAVLARARDENLRIRFAADTHLHADFLSGAVQLAHDQGATVLASAAGRRAFAHRGLRDGDQVELGGLTVTALATTGHTDEHLSFLVSDADRPVGVFTGGSLIVGSAARPDLLGPDRTDELARAQYASLRRLAALPGPTAVWPTHGAGSFCSAPPGAERTSTIAHELVTNPLLAAPDEQTFVDALLGSLGSHPGYFHLLGERNRQGPAVLDSSATGPLAPLPASLVAGLRSSGAVVVDVRPVAAYASGHLPGSVSIALRDQFASWLGWVVPAGAKIVVVREGDQDVADVVWKALEIGVETIVGELDGGVDAWAAAGHPLARTRLVDAADVDTAGHIVDVRQTVEYTAGHVPAAQHVELGSVAALVGDMAQSATVVMCGHGERAATAASLLERAGQRDVGIVVGGPWDWAQAHGRPLATGTDRPTAAAT
ncbi:beta-lactamase domain protein [Pseudonocardia dioxanivorans CB1190]|uniref:Beta-lactamase domain protein n=1 Tax=Pseudonocardia dioxanivorans (strain ATCC 55486 / DSM 44775 / JCM 13855 / CB1190) TaxID=675635 RepID=F4CXD7_PSEUX|nr:MBL fold metallo-hydrolase [Pseudonocardia dioxanivorans]AEA26511.1 beta-lactamase domain protein [Pseudonocardia dioxanivorans CB1190]